MKIVRIDVRPLTKAAFALFGDVIGTDGAEMRLINNGTTERYHDLAHVDVTGEKARVLINIFRGKAFALPVDINMLERHPFGSQAFMPLQNRPFLVVVAEDDAGRPGQPIAFLGQGGKGVNYGRNVWHHPLIALEESSDFLVIDRGGDGNNLEEYFWPDRVYRIEKLVV
jgi:ureidoglycolate lyase